MWKIFDQCILDIFAISWVIGKYQNKEIHKKKTSVFIAWSCRFIYLIIV